MQVRSGGEHSSLILAVAVGVRWCLSQSASERSGERSLIDNAVAVWTDFVSIPFRAGRGALQTETCSFGADGFVSIPFRAGRGALPETASARRMMVFFVSIPFRAGRGALPVAEVLSDNTDIAISSLNPLQSGEGSAPLPLVSPISSIICKGKSDGSADSLPGGQFSGRKGSKIRSQTIEAMALTPIRQFFLRIVGTCNSFVINGDFDPKTPCGEKLWQSPGRQDNRNFGGGSGNPRGIAGLLLGTTWPQRGGVGLMAELGMVRPRSQVRSCFGGGSGDAPRGAWRRSATSAQDAILPHNER